MNPDKVRLAVDNVKYLGHILSTTGLLPDPDKVSAIVNFPEPKNKEELARVLGMATYLMKFVPNFSKLISPLRELMKFTVDWYWDAYLTKRFEEMKQVLATAPVL